MTKDINRRIVLAGFLIIAGTALLLRNLNLLPEIPDYFFTWPMLVILFGSYLLITKQKIILSLFIMGAGLYFLLPEVAGVNIHDMRIFWPLLIIAAGIILIQKGLSHDRDISAEPEKIGPEINFINSDSVMSVSKKIILSQQFKGGKVNNIFGGSELNFLNAKLAPGKNNLELNAIFGGCTLIIPSDWNVNVEMVSVFGGFSDKRKISVSDFSGSSLVITGSCIFGGGEIKSHK